jgi:uncharacterized paraquat-inducible protein A
MSETTLRILLGELTTVRIVCAQCGGAAEVPADRLDQAQHAIACPGCGTSLRPAGRQQVDDFDRLALALRGLAGKAGFFSVEFVVKEAKP